MVCKESLGAVEIKRHSCRGYTLYGEAGASTSAKGLLDKSFQDKRLLDVEVRLAARLHAPFQASAAAVLYQLEVPTSAMSGNARQRRELEGQNFFYKAGFVTSSCWFMRAHSWKESEEVWLAKIVGNSYVNRDDNHSFWRALFLNARPQGCRLKVNDLVCGKSEGYRMRDH